MSDLIEASQSQWDMWAPVRHLGDLYLCRRLLINNRPVNIRGGESKRTLLHFAAFGGHFEVCKLMLEYRAKVDAVDKNGDTPIALAVLNGEVGVCRLLASYGASLDHDSERGESLLLRAARQKHLKVCSFLLEPRRVPWCREIRLPPIDVDRASSSGLTALGAAVDSGSEDVCRLLLDHGANPYYRPKTTDPAFNKRLTPFERAVQNGSVSLAQMLNEKDEVDPFGVTATGDTLEDLVSAGVAHGDLDDERKEMLVYLNSLRTEWAIRTALAPASSAQREERKTSIGPL
jgi:ankyrin repeat protein